MDIDSMTPDELRRRLRDAIQELEQLKRRFTGEKSNEYTLTLTNEGWRITALPSASVR